MCVCVQPLFLQGWIRLNDPSSSHCRSTLFGPFLLGFTGQPVPRQHCGGSEGVLGYRAVDMEMNWDGNGFLRCLCLATPLFCGFAFLLYLPLDENLLKLVLPGFRLHLIIITIIRRYHDGTMFSTIYFPVSWQDQVTVVSIIDIIKLALQEIPTSCRDPRKHVHPSCCQK